MTDDRDQMRTVLAKVVEQAPEPPTVDEIAERIESGPTVRVGGPGRDAAPNGVRRARVALAAAVVLAVLAVGAVLVTGSDDAGDGSVASDPVSPVAGDEPVAAVPVTPPPGYALIWASDTSVGGWQTMLRYGGGLESEPLVVSSTVVELGSDVPVTGVSGSIERWGGRDVTVDEDGRRAWFVDPGGPLVEVTGEPADVAEVVPTLAVKDPTGWREFLEDVSDDIEALPVTAGQDLLPDGTAVGIVSPSGHSEIHELGVTLHHGDGRVADATGSPDLAPDTSSGVVAGTCLTVNDVTTCRPTEPMASTRDAGVQTTYGVLVEGIWWEFGWSTEELTGVSVVTDRKPGGEAVRRWAHGSSTAGGDMSWYATPVLEGTSIEVELTGVDGGRSRFEQVRPAT